MYWLYKFIEPCTVEDNQYDILYSFNIKDRTVELTYRHFDNNQIRVFNLYKGYFSRVTLQKINNGYQVTDVMHITDDVDYQRSYHSHVKYADRTLYFFNCGQRPVINLSNIYLN